MKRRYEVAYYECGLTRRLRRKFFCRLMAYLYKGWLEYKVGNFGCIELTEDE
jgi:hypothetical protein